VGKHDLARLLNSNNGLFITEDGEVIGADNIISQQLEISIKRARKEPDFYHVISLRGMKFAKNARKTRDEAFSDVTTENACKMDGWGDHYRGKHRSETKGAGMSAWFRSKRYGNDRPRALHKKK
jgi:hypothetical protein